jgi:peptide/nickel transport system substrate-binding protein
VTRAHFRGNGKAAWFGWPTDAKMGVLYDSWFEAPEVAAQKKVCEAMHVEFCQNPPYVPVGMFNEPTAFNQRITDVPEGWPRLLRLKRA